MTAGSGINAQLGVGEESTVGTGVTPTRFYPFLDESLTLEREPMESEAIIAGARTLRAEQWAQGKINPNGSIGLELPTVGLGLWLKHALGGVATSGSGPYTHTFTPGDLTGKGLTIQVGVPDVAGTVHPFTFTGCRITSWEIAVSAGEIATFGVDVVGMGGTTATALAAASYPTNAGKPFTFIDAAITLAGSAFPVKEATFNGENPVDDERYFVGSPTRGEPIENGLRTYGGTLNTEFLTLTAYNRFVNGTTAALVGTFTNGAQVLTITENVRTDGTTPQVGSREVVPHEIPFRAVGTTTDASAITITYVTTESTP